MKNRQSIFNYIEENHGIKPDYPWNTLINHTVLRHGSNHKWFGLIMHVKKQQLGLEVEGSIDIINLKLDPALIGSLRLSKGFLPAYHMNKEHWVTILLDGAVPMKEVYSLIDISFTLTKNK